MRLVYGGKETVDFGGSKPPPCGSVRCSFVSCGYYSSTMTRFPISFYAKSFERVVGKTFEKVFPYILYNLSNSCYNKGNDKKGDFL